MDRISKALNLFTILIIFNLSITSSCQECQDILIKSIKEIFKFNPKNPLMYVGKTLSDLGDYNSCNLLEDSKYFVIHILLKLTSPIVFNLRFFLGVCVPKVCYTEDNMNKMKNYIEKLSHAVIKKDEINIIDPLEENRVVKNYDIYTVICLVLFIFYVLFAGLVGKFVKEEKETEDKDEEKVLIIAEINKEQITNKGADKNKQISSWKSLSVKETEYTERDADPQANNYFQVSEVKERRSKLKGILLCFSITGNWEYLSNLQNEKNSSNLNVLKGIIVIFTLLTICKHLPFLLFNMALRNPEYVFDEFQSLFYQFFFNIDFSYDYIIAFYGFFLAYNQLMKKTDSNFVNLLKNIFFEILKFWVPFIVAFLIYYKFFGYMVGGPTGGYILNKEFESCKLQAPYITSFLASFTYGNWEKFFPYCFYWNWFIINTAQYSIFGLVLLHIHQKRRWLFITLISILISTCALFELLVLLQNNLGVNIYEINLSLDYFREYYFKFYTRIYPFFLGFFFGMLFAQYKLRTSDQTVVFFQDIKNSSIISFTFALFGSAVMVFMIIITHWSYEKNVWSSNLKLLYNFLSKKLFVLGAFVFALPFLVGRLGLVGNLLKSKYLMVLSELTLSALIMSGFALRLFLLNKIDFFFVNGNYNNVVECGFVAVTYIFALPFAVLFEIPVRRIAIKFCEEQRDDIDLYTKDWSEYTEK